MSERSGQRGPCRWIASLGALLTLSGGLSAFAAGMASAQPSDSVGHRAAAVQTASVPSAALPSPASVLDARLGVHPDKTRFVLELTAAVTFDAFTDGKRIIVDLPDLAWDRASPPAGKGMVRSVQVQRAGGRLRIALETQGPTRIALAEVIPPRDGRPPRLIVDLVPDAKRDGGRGASKDRPSNASGAALAALPVGRSGVGIAVGIAGRSAEFRQPDEGLQSARTAQLPAEPVPVRVALTTPAAKPQASHVTVPTLVSFPGIGAVPRPSRKPPPRYLPLIVLDAGHGGQDPGATAINGVYEKDITLSVAREVRRQLQATGRFRVAMTRDSDIFIRLRDRVEIARGKGADLFISLHADSIGRPGIRGLSVYTLSDKASDREAEMLAQRENRSDAIAGMDLSDHNREVASILIDLARRDTANQSRRFAGLIVEKAGPQVELLQRPIRSAGFAVLTAPDVPSVLIELGYLSHPKDAKLLVTAAHQKRLAAGIIRAIDAYFLNGPVLSRS